MSAHHYAAAAAAVDDVAMRSQAAKLAKGTGSRTHFELAEAWLDAKAVGKHRPVYCGGQFFVPDSSGLWTALEIETAETEIARLFADEKLCRKAGDYRGIASVAAASASDPRFFECPPLGVVTPAGFHTLDADGELRVTPLQLDHRQTFRTAWSPDGACPMPLTEGMIAAALAGDDCDGQTVLLWELIGGILFGLLPRIQRAALLLGREQSGKSTLQRLIERLFPADAVSAVSPASWGREYNVAGLAGRRLNVVGELADDAPIPAAAFKNVTGLNLIEGRHPNHRPFSFVCSAAQLFASNVLPSSTDRTEAFFRRWVIVQFRNRVADGQADPDLLEKILAAEVPGILARAFDAAADVAARKGLSLTKTHEGVIAKWRAAANPVLQFLLDDQAVELDRTALDVCTKRVYEHYRRWSGAAGFRNPFGRNHFLELLDATGSQVGVSVKRNLVRGLRLLADD